MAMFRFGYWFAAVLACTGTALGQSVTFPEAAPKPLPAQIVEHSQPLPSPNNSMHDENLTPIHPQLAELQWRNDSWVLVDGDTTIKDFGRHEKEARAALGLIRDLGLTQRGTIGSPQPIMEYWLVNGHAPSGARRALNSRPIDLASLRVEQAQKQWVVRDNYQILFNFGAQEQDARQAAAVMHQYGFTQIGALGSGVPAMLVLFGNPEQTALDQRSLHVPHMSSLSQPMPEALSPGSTAGSTAPTPTLQHRSPLRPHDGDKQKDENVPPLASLPQGRQLAVARQLMPEMATGAERVPFDWRQLQARKEGQDWQLRAGQYTVAHFGSDQVSAEKALNVLQFYRCNEQCQVGAPAAFTYFLANGQAPRGKMLGLASIAIQYDALKIQQTAGAWTISDGNHILFSFATEEAAKQVLQAVQKHKFDHLCRIGHGETPAMTFLVRMN